VKVWTLTAHSYSKFETATIYGVYSSIKDVNAAAREYLAEFLHTKPEDVETYVGGYLEFYDEDDDEIAWIQEWEV
jgi:hypothetical protein